MYDVRGKMFFIDHYLLCLKAREPTNEARAETKLVWAMPCKEEEDRRSKRGKCRYYSHTDPTDLTDYIFHAESAEISEMF